MGLHRFGDPASALYRTPSGDFPKAARGDEEVKAANNDSHQVQRLLEACYFGSDRLRGNTVHGA